MQTPQLGCVLCTIFLGYFISSAAIALPVQYTLADVVFADDGAATGSFVFDADTNTFTNISIATTTGSTMTSGRFYEFMNPDRVSDKK